MDCREFRNLADSFLSDELLTETNHEVLRHLETCPACRAEMGVRRQLRASLRDAFEHAPDLQPQPDFAERLRDQMRAAALDARRGRPLSARWLMLAAGLVLAVGLARIVFVNRTTQPVDALARDAMGDHWNCALKNRLIRTPIPLEQAAQRFDRVYRRLETAPPDEISTANGPARVVDRHTCAFGTRRFGHVVLQYRQHVVSLLVTAADERTAGTPLPPDLVPHLHGGPVNGLSVASVRGAQHAILLVSDLEQRELTELSTAVSVPLVEQLASRLPVPDMMAAVYPSVGLELQRPRSVR